MVEAGLDPLVRPGGLHDHLAAMRWLARETAAWGATHLWTSLSRANLIGLILGPRKGLPVFCWQHNAFLKTGNRVLLRALQSRAHTWIADSSSVAALTRWRLGVEESRLMTWPIFAADRAAPVARPWTPGEPLRLGSLGRLHPIKGYGVLIEALRLLRQDGFVAPVPFTVTIAGEGALRDKLESAVRVAGLTNFQMPGFEEQPREFLANLHLYLQPSLAEGFCIAAHEAMVAGLPVLASAVGELPNTIVPSVTGLTVPPLNPVALASALRQLLSHPNALHAMGTASRAHVLERFSQQKFVAAGEELFTRMAFSAA
jgi:glycosyltransferase involved in cell wall biosynthesis